MASNAHWDVVEAQARGQLALQKALVRHVWAERDPKLCLAWVGLVLELNESIAATLDLLPALKSAPRHTALPGFPPLSLPEIPSPPHREGGPPPPIFRKTTGSRLSNRNRDLGSPSSPAKRGSKTPLRVKSKGGAPKGNRNALKTGCHTRGFRAFRRAVLLYARTVKAEMALLRTLLPASQPRVVTLVSRPERCYVRTRLSRRAGSHEASTAAGAGKVASPPQAPLPVSLPQRSRRLRATTIYWKSYSRGLQRPAVLRMVTMRCADATPTSLRREIRGSPCCSRSAARARANRASGPSGRPINSSAGAGERIAA
jgi:hypothetical protein